MPAYAAFLRGVNLAKHHRVSGAELQAVFAELGFRDVRTFRASGNVAFEGDREPREKLAARIEEGLEAALGFAVPTFIRTADELRAIAEHEPFDRGLVDTSGGKLQVSLLPKRPAKRAQSEVLALATDEDRLAFGERELYWLPSGGLLESELDLDAIEKALGPITRRTKGTMEAFAAKHFAG